MTEATRILGNEWHLPILERIFLLLRWLLTPYTQMSQRLPIHGEIIDLGCGHGLFSIHLAKSSPERQVRGRDHDEGRIASARSATREISNVDFEVGDLSEFNGTYNGIALIDVLHYFSKDRQEAIVAKCFHSLLPGGTLLVREIEPRKTILYGAHCLYEWLAIKLRFTKTASTEMWIRKPEEWISLLRVCGFDVSSERANSRLFSDILFVCRK